MVASLKFPKKSSETHSPTCNGCPIDKATRMPRFIKTHGLLPVCLPALFLPAPTITQTVRCAQALPCTPPPRSLCSFQQVLQKLRRGCAFSYCWMHAASLSTKLMCSVWGRWSHGCDSELTVDVVSVTSQASSNYGRHAHRPRSSRTQCAAAGPPFQWRGRL